MQENLTRNVLGWACGQNLSDVKLRLSLSDTHPHHTHTLKCLRLMRLLLLVLHNANIYIPLVSLVFLHKLYIFE